MRNRTPLLLPVVVALALPGVLVSSGCQSGGGDWMSSATSAISGLTGDWDLSKLAGVDINSLLPQGAKVPSLNFAQDGKVSGFSGVNRLSSMLDLDKLAKGEFALGPAASTRMAGPPEAMKVEDQFLAALTKASEFKLDGNNLSLLDQGKELLGFTKR